MAGPLYWIWLQKALGQGNYKANVLLDVMNSPEAVYHMSKQDLLDTKIFLPKEVDKILQTDISFAEKQLAKAEKCGCTVLTPEDSAYPKCFLHVGAIPLALYVLGDLSTLSQELALTIVGTRESTQHGQNTAAKLSHDLCAAGCTIVSGLAVGIDYAAHEGALSLGGRTIGLLACGVDVDYPKASNALKRRILDANGALISEFFFGDRPLPFHFNIRNRLMSGIASGVIVVQAPLVSGALNTASHALEQGVDVFATPGDIFDPLMAGCNALIQQGAKMVINVYSILEEYILRFPNIIDVRTTRKKILEAPPLTRAQLQEKKLPFGKGSFFGRRKKPKMEPANSTAGLLGKDTSKKAEKKAAPVREVVLPDGISENAKLVFEKIENTPISCDSLKQSTGIPISDLLVALTELEIFGLVRALPGQQYSR